MNETELDLKIARITGNSHLIYDMFGYQYESITDKTSPLKYPERAFELIVEYNLDVTPKSALNSTEVIWEVYCGGSLGSSSKLEKAICLAVYEAYGDKK